MTDESILYIFKFPKVCILIVAFISEHVYMWITLWISCEFHIIFWKNLEELEEKEYTIVNNGEVPKRLKGSHSKCDRS